MSISEQPAPQNIVSFVQLRRMVGDAVSGVGRHAISMLGELSRQPEFNLSLMVGSDDFRECAQDLPDPVQSIPLQPLPMPRKTLEWMWKATGRPSVDRWVKDVDWIYCPAEAFVPTKSARLAVTVHDLHEIEPLPWTNSWRHRRSAAVWRMMLARIVSRADAILTVSEFTKKSLGNFVDINPQKIFVVGNGVDLAQFYPSETKPSAPYLLVVGGLITRKGGHFVLQVADMLRKADPRIQIKVVGRCEPGMAETAAKAANIQLLGYVGYEELPKLYREAAALYFPSLYEGFGIPVVEALASGVPVICSQHPALVEVGRGAVVSLPAEDIKAAAEAICRIVDDPAFSLGLRTKAISVRHQLGWDSCLQRLKAVLMAPR